MEQQGQIRVPLIPGPMGVFPDDRPKDYFRVDDLIQNYDATSDRWLYGRVTGREGTRVCATVLNVSNQTATPTVHKIKVGYASDEIWPVRLEEHQLAATVESAVGYRKIKSNEIEDVVGRLYNAVVTTRD